MSRIGDFLGTVFAKFQIGIGGPQVKNNAGVLESRNAADSAYAAIAASLFKTYGNDFELNSGAAESGADWKFKLSRPSTGMTHDLQVIFPAGDPSAGQAMTVTSFVGNVITLDWASVGAGAQLETVDTTTLAFGSTSPVAMYTAPANAVQLKFQIIIDTPFNGTPTMSVGIAGTTSKYVSSTQVDLTAAAGTVFEICPGVAAAAGTENLIATYSAGGASAGSARILGFYAVPA